MKGRARAQLRWKILLFTVLPLVTLAFATLWVLNRRVTHQVHQSIHDDLRRASAVLENVLEARARSLTVAGQMTVHDPKFFSVLTIPGAAHDPQVRATVAGVARDFNTITRADLFEVTDARGAVIVQVGRTATVPEGREAWVREALTRGPVAGLLVQPGAHFQVSVSPVFAGGRVVGALLLGEQIDAELALEMRRLTRSEVTFVSGGAITGSTLESAAERDAARGVVAGLAGPPSAESRGGTVLEARGGTHLYLTWVRPLDPSAVEPTQFYVMQRALDAETAFLRQVQVELLGLGLAAVIAALLAGYLISERITAPVRSLVRGAEEMERGNYDYPLGVSSNDEIGELAARFDEMRRQQRDVVRGLQEVARVKSEFITVASHELRTPISVIRGFQELMLDGKLGDLTPQQRLALEATDQSVATLTRIAEDATRMAQIEGDLLVIRPAEHVVDEMVAEAAAAARSMGGRRKVSVATEVAPDAGRVWVDGPGVVQALTNLISNGIRFTPDGGWVEVRAERDGTDLVLTVRDNGIGISEQDQQHVFERSCLLRDSLNHHSSSTLEFKSAGLGLGLPIARGIAEAHGGSIAVHSVPGAGSTFVLRLPAAPGEAQQEAA